MKFAQPFDGRNYPTVPTRFTPAPIGYRIRKNPRAKKLWTFVQSHAAAVAELNTLRKQGYRRATIEPLYIN